MPGVVLGLILSRQKGKMFTKYFIIGAKGYTKDQHTPLPKGTRQNSRPHYFLCTTPHRCWQVAHLFTSNLFCLPALTSTYPILPLLSSHTELFFSGNSCYCCHPSINTKEMFTLLCRKMNEETRVIEVKEYPELCDPESCC